MKELDKSVLEKMFEPKGRKQQKNS